MKYLLFFALLVPGMAMSEVYQCADGVIKPIRVMMPPRLSI
ncbi:exported protein of unknown function [Shewanella benthica]|uniref:DUF4124 domain-containing protein n=1 Tax=Shewanella benthica TaxID=43661 RepID=A0A330M6A7_9GAMM|nr:exported protein of unknown function [Shewanella benthica]